MNRLSNDRKTRPKSTWVNVACATCLISLLCTATTSIASEPSSPNATTNAFTHAFEALWHDMDRKYSYFELKPDVDWDKVREEYGPRFAKAESTGAFVETLRECLGQLKDMHIWIDGPSGRVGTFGIPWRRNWNFGVVRRDLTEVVECGAYAIVGKTRADGFGYVGIINQSKATMSNVLLTVDAIQRLKDVPGFIVDLRPGCSGGNEMLARPIASAFNDEVRVYAANRYRIQMKGHALGPILERKLDPGTKPFTGPVACLIGHRCMSSGEALVLMFACLPHATTIGETTRGSSGNPKPFKLPGVDVTVAYSRWMALTPDHKPFEGTGIAPDIAVNAKAKAYAKGDPTWQRALEFMREKVKR